MLSQDRIASTTVAEDDENIKIPLSQANFAPDFTQQASQNMNFMEFMNFNQLVAGYSPSQFMHSNSNIFSNGQTPIFRNNSLFNSFNTPVSKPTTQNFPHRKLQQLQLLGNQSSRYSINNNDPQPSPAVQPLTQMDYMTMMNNNNSPIQKKETQIIITNPNDEKPKEGNPESVKSNKCSEEEEVQSFSSLAKYWQKAGGSQAGS